MAVAHAASHPARHPCCMETLYMWHWYLPGLNGKFNPSRWRMTEEDAHLRHPGCARVEGSLEVRQFEPGTGHSMASGLVRRDDGAMVQPAQACDS